MGTGLSRLIKKIHNGIVHPFTKGVAWLQIGSVANRVIAFGTSLVFARILGPEGYGYYSLVFAVAGTISVALDWGIGPGVTNLLAKAWAEKNREEIKNLFAYFTKASLTILATAGVIGTALSPFVGQWFYQNWELGALSAIVVATSALTLFYPLIQIVLQIVGRMRELTALETTYKFLLSVIPIGLMIAGYSVLGIVAGHFIAMILVSLLSLIIYQKLRAAYHDPTTPSLLPPVKDWFTTAIPKEKMSSYFTFGFLIAISKNIVKLTTSLPFLFLGAALSTQSELGYYKIAFAYMSLPVFLLSPVSRLLSTKLPEIETKASAEQTFRRFWQVTGMTTAASIVLTAGALILGPLLITLFYGQSFSPSIQMMYGLSLYPIASALGVGLGPLFRTLNKMKEVIIMNVMTLAALVPTSFYLINAYGIRGLVFVTVFFTLAPNVLSLIYFHSLSKKCHKQENHFFSPDGIMTMKGAEKKSSSTYDYPRTENSRS